MSGEITVFTNCCKVLVYVWHFVILLCLFSWIMNGGISDYKWYVVKLIDNLALGKTMK
jgi:hypothetical protein